MSGSLSFSSVAWRRSFLMPKNSRRPWITNMRRATLMGKRTSGLGPFGSSATKVEIAGEKQMGLLGVLGLWLGFGFGVYALQIL